MASVAAGAAAEVRDLLDDRHGDEVGRQARSDRPSIECGSRWPRSPQELRGRRIEWSLRRAEGALLPSAFSGRRASHLDPRGRARKLAEDQKTKSAELGLEARCRAAEPAQASQSARASERRDLPRAARGRGVQRFHSQGGNAHLLDERRDISRGISTTSICSSKADSRDPLRLRVRHGLLAA